MVTKLMNSNAKRFADELLKDINSLITKTEKLNKTLKKIQIDPSSIDMSGFKTLQTAIKAIESAEQEINILAVRFGVADEKTKRGAKRKAPAATYYAVRPSVRQTSPSAVRPYGRPSDYFEKVHQTHALHTLAKKCNLCCFIFIFCSIANLKNILAV